VAPFVMLGIDLGTSKCLAGISIRGSVHWVPAGQGFASDFAPRQNLTAGHGFLPSVYCYGTDGSSANQQSREFLGQRAIVLQGANPGRVIRNSKRFMHRQYESNGYKPLIWPLQDDFGNVKRVKPADIAGQLLKHLLEQAEARLRELRTDLQGTWDWDGGRIRRAVITVPAYFGSDQRRATKEYAGLQFAGLDQVELLEEPLAAAIGLGLHRRRTPQTVMIVDVGAGTTDLALLKVGEASAGLCEIGRFGDNNLGCLNWDVEIAKMLLNKGLADDPSLEPRLQGFDRSDDSKNERYGFDREGTVLTVAEEAKVHLCNQKLNMPYYAEWQEGQRIIEAPLARDEMEFATRHFAQWVGKVCQRLLDSVNRVQEKENPGSHKPFGWGQVDEVYLVGGGARIPQIVREVKKVMTPKYESRLQIPEMPEILVAKGAAMYAEMFAHGEGLEAIAMRRLPHDIGITSHILSKNDDPHCEALEERGIHFFDIIPANASLPKEFSDPPRVGTRIFPFSNPDEPVVQLQLWERSFSIDYEDGLLKPLGMIHFDGREPLWKNGWSWWGAPKKFELTLELDINHKLTAFIRYGRRYEEIRIRSPFSSNTGA